MAVLVAVLVAVPGGGPGGSSSTTFISAPTTPSLASGNNVSDGTDYFEGNCIVANNGGSDGIEDYELDQQVNDPRIFTLDGRYLGTSLPEGFRGVYIQNGKKYFKFDR